jgi:hypothetical protein
LQTRRAVVGRRAVDLDDTVVRKSATASAAQDDVTADRAARA